MAREHLGDEHLSDTETCRGLDFASLEILERWLSKEGLDVPHNEAEPNGVGAYLHQGYEAFLCTACQQPTIAGIGSTNRTCGRRACDPGAPAGML